MANPDQATVARRQGSTLSIIALHRFQVPILRGRLQAASDASPMGRSPRRVDGDIPPALRLTSLPRAVDWE
jgi:hypothetical protein